MATVASGVDMGEPTLIEDRRSAINAAIERAESGDTVMILGKGHESTQTIGDEVITFDDRVVARAALAGRGFDVVVADGSGATP